MGGNRRSRRFDGHDARSLAVRSAIKELGIEGVIGYRGCTETFEFECLRDLNGYVRNNHRVHTHTPNHQITCVLLVIEGHDAVDGTSLVSDVRFRSHAHKRRYLTSTFGSIGTVPIEAYTNETTCRRLAGLEEIIGVGIGCSKVHIEVLQSLARSKLITIQASPRTIGVFKPCMVLGVIVVIVFRRENIQCSCCAGTNLFVFIGQCPSSGISAG